MMLTDTINSPITGILRLLPLCYVRKNNCHKTSKPCRSTIAKRWGLLYTTHFLWCWGQSVRQLSKEWQWHNKLHLTVGPIIRWFLPYLGVRSSRKRRGVCRDGRSRVLHFLRPSPRQREHSFSGNWRVLVRARRSWCGVEMDLNQRREGKDGSHGFI